MLVAQMWRTYPPKRIKDLTVVFKINVSNVNLYSDKGFLAYRYIYLKKKIT